jgi:probable HAF family extracellular repeat protein
MRIRTYAFLIGLLGCNHGLLADVLYSVNDLGPGAGYGINNNAGQVTGMSGSHAFLYNNGQITDLGTLGGNSSTGNGINNAGQVTGSSTTSTNVTHGFLYSNGQMIDLGSLTSGFTSGDGINDAGQVTGSSNGIPSLSGFFPRAFLYSNGQMIDLGGFSSLELEFLRLSGGYGINNAGQVTGWAETYLMYRHAFLYSNGSMRDLGTLAGDYSIGRAINNAGQVTGESSSNRLSFLPGDPYDHAFLYSNNVGMRDLGTLVGSFSNGYAINNAGQVTGSSSISTSSAAVHAFLYQDSQMFDLNDLIDPALGVTLTEGRGINDNGQILANGGGRPYVLTPISVPEPKTWALLGLPLLALLGWRYRCTPELHR